MLSCPDGLTLTVEYSEIAPYLHYEMPLHFVVMSASYTMTPLDTFLCLAFKRTYNHGLVLVLVITSIM